MKYMSLFATLCLIFSFLNSDLAQAQEAPTLQVCVEINEGGDTFCTTYDGEYIGDGTWLLEAPRLLERAYCLLTGGSGSYEVQLLLLEVVGDTHKVLETGMGTFRCLG